MRALLLAAVMAAGWAGAAMAGPYGVNQTTGAGGAMDVPGQAVPRTGLAAFATAAATTVSEPASLALLGLGVGFTGLLARRRKTAPPDQGSMTGESSCEAGLRRYADLAREQGNTGSAILLGRAADLIGRGEQNQSTAAALLIFSMVAEEEGRADLAELLTTASNMLYQRPAQDHACNLPAMCVAA